MENFVPYELAVKLKEKGFKDNCIGYYDYAGKFHYNYKSAISNKEIYFCHRKYDNIWHRDLVAAPTISQVLKWLREEKELHIEIYMYHNCYLWEIYNTKIYDADFSQKSEKYSEIEYATYEIAALAGIKYCLDNLI